MARRVAIAAVLAGVAALITGGVLAGRGAFERFWLRHKLRDPARCYSWETGTDAERLARLDGERAGPELLEALRLHAATAPPVRLDLPTLVKSGDIERIFRSLYEVDRGLAGRGLEPALRALDAVVAAERDPAARDMVSHARGLVVVDAQDLAHEGKLEPAERRLLERALLEAVSAKLQAQGGISALVVTAYTANMDVDRASLRLVLDGVEAPYPGEPSWEPPDVRPEIGAHDTIVGLWGVKLASERGASALAIACDIRLAPPYACDPPAVRHVTSNAIPVSPTADAR